MLVCFQGLGSPVLCFPSVQWYSNVKMATVGSCGVREATGGLLRVREHQLWWLQWICSNLCLLLSGYSPRRPVSVFMATEGVKHLLAVSAATPSSPRLKPSFILPSHAPPRLLPPSPHPEKPSRHLVETFSTRSSSLASIGHRGLGLTGIGLSANTEFSHQWKVPYRIFVAPNTHGASLLPASESLGTGS